MLLAIRLRALLPKVIPFCTFPAEGQQAQALFDTKTSSRRCEFTGINNVENGRPKQTIFELSCKPKIQKSPLDGQTVGAMGFFALIKDILRGIGHRSANFCEFIPGITPVCAFDELPRDSCGGTTSSKGLKPKCLTEVIMLGSAKSD